MTISTLTIDGKEYAVIPMEEYRRAFDRHGVPILPEEEMTEQDRGDLAEFHRLEDEPEIPYEDAQKQLGLK